MDPPLPFRHPWSTPDLLTNSLEKDGRDLEGGEGGHESRNPHTLQGLWEVEPTLTPALSTRLLLTVLLQAGHFQKGKPHTPSGRHVGKEAQASGDERHRTGGPSHHPGGGPAIPQGFPLVPCGPVRPPPHHQTPGVTSIGTGTPTWRNRPYQVGYARWLPSSQLLKAEHPPQHPGCLLSIAPLGSSGERLRGWGGRSIELPASEPRNLSATSARCFSPGPEITLSVKQGPKVT